MGVGFIFLLAWPRSRVRPWCMGGCWSWSWSRRRCRSWCRRQSRCSCRCWRRYGPLHLKGADVDAAVHYAIKVRAALAVERRRSEVRITRINGRAAEQQLMRECGAAIVLQWAKHRIGVDQIAGTGQDTAAVVAADIVAKRCDRAGVIDDISSCCAGFEDRACHNNRRLTTIVAKAIDAAAVVSRVAADRAVCDFDHCSAGRVGIIKDAAADIR